VIHRCSLRVRSATVAATALLIAVSASAAFGAGNQGLSSVSDLSGYWETLMQQDFQIREAGPDFVSYLGVPINSDARAAALSYSADTVEEYQRECEPWPVTYLLMGPFGFKMTSTSDPISGALQAWHVTGAIDRLPMVIWMDGRTPPNREALHTYHGFTTGVWDGDTLVTTTSHVKDGWLTRNGVPNSNQEHVTMFWTRHGDLLTITGFIHDPVYLTAPYVLSRPWRHRDSLSAAQLDDSVADNYPDLPPMNCMPEEEDPGISNGYHVASILPGENRLLMTDPQMYHIPLSAALGGAQTMYPQFRKTLKRNYTVPQGYCKTNCMGTGLAGSGGNSFF